MVSTLANRQQDKETLSFIYWNFSLDQARIQAEVIIQNEKFFSCKTSKTISVNPVRKSANDKIRYMIESSALLYVVEKNPSVIYQIILTNFLTQLFVKCSKLLSLLKSLFWEKDCKWACSNPRRVDSGRVILYWNSWPLDTLRGTSEVRSGKYNGDRKAVRGTVYIKKN